MNQPCPACEGTIPEGAALCMSCGYNVLTGKKTKAASARKADMAATTRRFALGAGTFALGCALSAVGALVGAIVWSVVCLVTEYEIGYIAWGLGVLAGIGMAKGYPSANLRAGIAAAGIAAVGIVAAKGTTFVYLSYPELQSIQREVAAMSDEYAEDRGRLAGHRAEIRARRLGLSNSDEKYDSIFEEEIGEILELDDASLVVQLEELDAWEAGGKWSDQGYVRAFLIYDHINKEIQSKSDRDNADDDAEPWEPSPPEWRQLHAAAKRAVDEVGEKERLERAESIRDDRDRTAKSTRLAFHQYHMVGIDNPGVEPADSLEELTAKFQAMPAEERDAAIARLDAWEKGGKWDNVEYIRSVSINGHVDAEIQRRNEASEDENADWWEPSDAERKDMREQAARAIDAMPHDRRVAQLKDEEAKRETRIKDYQRQLSQEYSEEMAGEVLDFFFRNYFGAMDLLFAVLAIGSAFKIATGGGDDD